MAPLIAVPADKVEVGPIHSCCWRWLRWMPPICREAAARVAFIDLMTTGRRVPQEPKEK